MDCRNYIVINTRDVHLIDWDSVCQVDVSVCHISNNSEKILLSYIGGSIPEFLFECEGRRGIMTKQEAREMLQAESWRALDDENL